MKWATPRLWVVGIDETEYWLESIVKEAGRIMAVGLWDETEATYLCSITPSGYVYFIEHITEKRVSDEMYGEILTAADDDDYYDYGQLERMKVKIPYPNNPTKKEWKALVKEHEGDADAAYRELVDNALDYLRGNDVFSLDLGKLAGWKFGYAEDDDAGGGE